MIIRLNRFEAVIVCIIAVMVSFIFALSFEEKTATTSLKLETIELPIIMYHHITESKSKTGKYTVHKNEFEADMIYIKEKGYTPIMVSDLIAFVDKGRDLPQKPIMITFDDGFESFYKIAFPILKKHNIKAIVSVIGTTTEKYSQINDHNINYSNLTFEEIRDLSNSGIVEIQNHSYNLHKSNPTGRKGLSKLKTETDEQYHKMLTNDLMKLQGLLKENCQIAPSAVAYPYGAFSKATLSIIKECGFRCTFTCEEKINNLASGDTECLYNLGRFNRESGISTIKFFSKILLF